MAKIRQWAVGALVLVLAILAVGWFMLVSPQRSHASSLRNQADSQRQANVLLQQKISLLSKQAAGVAQNEARIAQIATKLPDTPQLASYVRDLSKVAAATNVDLVSIAATPPTAVANPTSVAHTAPTPAASGGASGSVGAATAGATAANATVQLQAITLALRVNGGYFSIQQFLSKLEGLPRVTLVDSISLTPGSALKPESVTATTSPSGGSASAPGAAAANTVPEWKTLNGSITITVFESGLGADTTTVAVTPGATSPAVGAPAAGAATASTGALPRPVPTGNN